MTLLNICSLFRVGGEGGKMLVECAFTILNLRLLLNPVMQLSVLAAAYNSGALAAQVTVKVIEFSIDFEHLFTVSSRW